MAEPPGEGDGREAVIDFLERTRIRTRIGCCEGVRYTQPDGDTVGADLRVSDEAVRSTAARREAVRGRLSTMADRLAAPVIDPAFQMEQRPALEPDVHHRLM